MDSTVQGHNQGFTLSINILTNADQMLNESLCWSYKYN